MTTTAEAIDLAEHNTYTSDTHAFADGRYDIFKVLSALPGDHVAGGPQIRLARVHAKSPTTIYDSSFDRSKNGRLRAATLITLLRLNLITPDTYQDVRAPIDSESLLKTWGEAVYAHMVCTLYPRAAVAAKPIQIAEIDALKLWDEHPETKEASLLRLQAAVDCKLSEPSYQNPFLFDTFKNKRNTAE